MEMEANKTKLKLQSQMGQAKKNSSSRQSETPWPNQISFETSQER